MMKTFSVKFSPECINSWTTLRFISIGSILGGAVLHIKGSNVKKGDAQQQ